MDSDRDTLAGGLPHSEIPGSPIARISPGLFAACYVLHRLSVPRHPPDALTLRFSSPTPNGKDQAGIGTPDIAGRNHRSGKLFSPEDTLCGPAQRGCSERGRRLQQQTPKTPDSRPSQNRYGHTTHFFTMVINNAADAASPPRELRPQGNLPADCDFCFVPRCRTQSSDIRSTRRPCRPQFRFRYPTRPLTSGGDRARTDDPLLAKQVLSQLSYTPIQMSDVGHQLSELHVPACAGQAPLVMPSF